ncbi:MAG: addiction module protein [Fibrobacter sp.]|nr:addiction module protein [Fibrobacter sp.]
MSLSKSQIFHGALNLSPIERAELIECLLESFGDNRQKVIDKKWVREAESRIDAYNAGKLKDMPISKVFEEIERIENKNEHPGS